MIGGVITRCLWTARESWPAAAGSSATVSGAASGPDGRTHGVGCRRGWGDGSHHRLRRPYQPTTLEFTCDEHRSTWCCVSAVVGDFDSAINQLCALTCWRRRIRNLAGCGGRMTA